MAATVGSLRIVLGANTANFEAGMKRAKREAATSATAIQRSLGGIKGAFGGLGAVFGATAIAGLVAVTKRGLEYAGSLGEIAQQLGVTTKELQEFRYIASQVGISQEQMDKGLQKFRVTMGQLAVGAAAPAKALEALKKGLSEAVQGKEAGEQLRLIADSLSKVGDSSKRAAIEAAIFGAKMGPKFDTMLMLGRKGMDELANAAHRLGLVLSEQQIQNADKTADKIEDLNTVLTASIAGAVANNTTSIYSFVSALIALVSAAGKAINWLDKLGASLGVAEAQAMQYSPWSSVRAAGRANEAAAKAQFEQAAGRPWGSTAAPGGIGWLDKNGGVTGNIGALPKPRERGADIGAFLAPRGGGRKGKKDTSAEDAERKRKEAAQRAFDIDRQLTDAKSAELQAQQALLTDYVDRQEISHQLIDIETEQQNKALAFAVKWDGMDAIAAEQLKAYHERLRILKKQEVNQQVELDRQRDFEETESNRYEIARSLLDGQSQLAETQSERRAIEIQLLEIAFEEKRRALQRLIDETKDDEARKRARAQLDALPAQQALAAQGVIQGTRGPLEQFQAGLPTTAAKMNEALQSVAVNGLQALEDGIISVIDGTKSLGAAFRDMASQIIADLLRIQIQRAIIGPLSNLLGGAIGGGSGGGVIASLAGASKSLIAANPGVFATGGYTGNMPTNRIAGFAHGQEYYFDAASTRRIGVDNLERLRKGMPMAGGGKRAGATYNINVTAANTGNPRADRQTAMQQASMVRHQVALSAKRGM